MTKFGQPSFTVPTGSRPEAECSHGWTAQRGARMVCVLCGARVGDAPPPPDMTHQRNFRCITEGPNRGNWEILPDGSSVRYDPPQDTNGGEDAG